MGVDSTARGSKRNLWLDRALVELNQAVLTSFDSKGISIVDHHTASDSFSMFVDREIKSRGYVTGDWVWLTPPISGSATTVFHQEIQKISIKPMFLTFKTPSFLFGKKAVKAVIAGWNSFSHSAVVITSQAKNIDLSMTNHVIAKRKKLGILVATETGTAEQFAHRFASLDAISGISTDPVLFEELGESFLSYLNQHEHVIFFVSTFGEGELPTSAANVLKEFNGQNELHHLKFSIFGLCSSTYTKTFNQGARHLSDVLKNQGAKLVGPIGEGDEINEREKHFLEWQHDVLTSMNMESAYTKEAVLGVTQVDSFNATVITSKSLFSDGLRGTWHVEFEANDLRYEPGDHLAIYPKNHPSSIAEVMSIFGLNDSTFLETLTSKVDINATPPLALLNALYERSQKIDSTLVNTLENLVQMDETNLGIIFPTILHVLRSFASLCFQWSPDAFVQVAATLTPRYYSIASSQPDKVVISVSKHFWNQNGTLMNGICSSYLTQLREGSVVKMNVRPCYRFRLPEKLVKDQFIILIANGTGIAPFRGFLEEFQNRKQRLNVLLLFGCRSPEEILYENELRYYLHEGYLKQVHIAFSRTVESPNFTPFHVYYEKHVQDILEDALNLFFEKIIKGGLIYICGSHQMGSSVTARLQDMNERSKNWIKQAKKEKRLFEDTY